MNFRFCKFEDKNMIIIQHEDETIGAVKLDDLKEFLNNKSDNVKFLDDEMQNN